MSVTKQQYSIKHTAQKQNFLLVAYKLKRLANIKPIISNENAKSEEKWLNLNIKKKSFTEDSGEWTTEQWLENTETRTRIKVRVQNGPYLYSEATILIPDWLGLCLRTQWHPDCSALLNLTFKESN